MSAPPSDRLLHLGLGSFLRAHQAWYAQHADDGAGWTDVGFTGRRPDLAEALASRDTALADDVAAVASVTDHARSLGTR